MGQLNWASYSTSSNFMAACKIHLVLRLTRGLNKEHECVWHTGNPQYLWILVSTSSAFFLACWSLASHVLYVSSIPVGELQSAYWLHIWCDSLVILKKKALAKKRRRRRRRPWAWAHWVNVLAGKTNSLSSIPRYTWWGELTPKSCSLVFTCTLYWV